MRQQGSVSIFAAVKFYKSLGDPTFGWEQLSDQYLVSAWKDKQAVED